MILLFGDSHTDIFSSIPTVVRFNRFQLQSEVITAQRLNDENNIDLQSKLNSWLENNTSLSKTLVMSVGEIDIRAHFWRHIPRNYVDKNSIMSFVKNKAEEYCRTLINLANKHNLERVVIWGPPAAGEKAAPYNSEYPFTGSSSTRNRLVHLWHKFIYEAIKDDSRFALASAFYNYVDTTTYCTFENYPSHDGTHWRDICGSTFWEKLVLPAINGNKLVLGVEYNTMVEHEFEIDESVSQGEQKYDSWVKSLYVNDPNFRKVNVNDSEYVWVSADHRPQLPSEYQELTLGNRQ